MWDETAQALMAVTETEAACLHLLETLERAREALRRTVEGGRDST